MTSATSASANNSTASPEAAAALLYCEQAERDAALVPDIGADVVARSVRKVGVVGAGTMGGGIAMNFLNTGIPVVLTDRSRAAVEHGAAVIRGNYERSASKGKLSKEDVDRRLSLLGTSVDLEPLGDCDLVIEAVFEDIAIKTALFERLDLICKAGCILATNTSYLDVNLIARATKRPSDVLGLHFFSPANVMKLLEVVRGRETADDVIVTAMQIARTIGKVPVLVGVCHGFVGNRMLSARRTQAFSLIQEGAMPWDVDRVLEEFGMPMGPFAMTDLAGLDVGWSPERSRGETVLRDKLCELGRRGQKVGAGYYNYDPASRARSVDEGVRSLVEQYAAKSGLSQRRISDEEILERCLYSSINEGARIIEERIAQRASDIDVIWVNGYGWPKQKGGPMYWADCLGLGHVLDAVRRYESALGEAWAPADLLIQLVERGGRFTDVRQEGLSR
jgi:3-hydroxyacyl-CoA dehydrogenase